MHNWNGHKIIHIYLKYRMSQNFVHKLGRDVDIILRNHNYIGTPGWKLIGGDVSSISRLACVAAQLMKKKACNQHGLHGQQSTWNLTTTRTTSLHCWCEDEYHGRLFSGTIYLTPWRRRIIDHLNQKLENNLIRSGGPVAWLFKSSDFYPHDFFFLGVMKNIVYDISANSKMDPKACVSIAKAFINATTEVFEYICQCMSNMCHLCIHAIDAISNSSCDALSYIL